MALPDRASVPLVAWDEGLPEGAPAAAALPAAEVKRAWTEVSSDRVEP